MEKSNSNFDDLLLESIQIDSSAVNPVRDEAFAKVQVELPDINHPKPILKMKVEITKSKFNIFTKINLKPLPWRFQLHMISKIFSKKAAYTVCFLIKGWI